MLLEGGSPFSDDRGESVGIVGVEGGLRGQEVIVFTHVSIAQSGVVDRVVEEFVEHWEKDLLFLLCVQVDDVPKGVEFGASRLQIALLGGVLDRGETGAKSFMGQTHEGEGSDVEFSHVLWGRGGVFVEIGAPFRKAVAELKGKCAGWAAGKLASAGCAARSPKVPRVHVVPNR